MVNSANILIVDDNKVNREVLKDLTFTIEHTPVLAENGALAIARIKKEHPDIVLLDILMPVMDGYEVLDHMKGDTDLRHIPIIMISAVDEMDSVVQCIEKGADDYLIKPFNPILLKARISACLEKKRLRDKEEEYRHQIEEYNQNLSEAYENLQQEYEARILAEKKLKKIRRSVFAFIFVFLFILSYAVFENVHQFLAVTKPIHGQILVAGPSMPVHEAERVAEEFRQGNYKLIITTGEISKNKKVSIHARSFAAALEKAGFDPKQIKILSFPKVEKDRTYTSAAMLKQWLKTTDLSVKAINVYSHGPHARRTWLLYEYVFEPEIKTGIISADNNTYNPQTWWKTSNGVRTTLNEAIAYMYARLIFRPD
ncbi:response regulator [Desulfobacterales bacterium HSG16]|nr:response regulator [Desulfobacterales bacterium HSG16]